MKQLTRKEFKQEIRRLYRKITHYQDILEKARQAIDDAMCDMYDDQSKLGEMVGYGYLYNYKRLKQCGENK